MGVEVFDSGKFCRCGKEMLITLKPNGEVKNIYCPDETCIWNNRLGERLGGRLETYNA